MKRFIIGILLLIPLLLSCSTDNEEVYNSEVNVKLSGNYTLKDNVLKDVTIAIYHSDSTLASIKNFMYVDINTISFDAKNINKNDIIVCCIGIPQYRYLNYSTLTEFRNNIVRYYKNNSDSAIYYGEDKVYIKDNLYISMIQMKYIVGVVGDSIMVLETMNPYNPSLKVTDFIYVSKNIILN